MMVNKFRMDFKPLELLSIPLFLHVISVNELLTGISALTVAVYTLHQHYDYIKNKKNKKS